MGLYESVRREQTRSEHCKVYVEPALKRAIQKYANEQGLSFSEAGRNLWFDHLKYLEALANPINIDERLYERYYKSH